MWSSALLLKEVRSTSGQLPPMATTLGRWKSIVSVDRVGPDRKDPLWSLCCMVWHEESCWKLTFSERGQLTWQLSLAMCLFYLLKLLLLFVDSIIPLFPHLCCVFVFERKSLWLAFPLSQVSGISSISGLLLHTLSLSPPSLFRIFHKCAIQIDTGNTIEVSEL